MSETTRTANKVVDEIAKDSESLLEPRVDPEESKENRTPGFTRMRTEWNPEDAAVIQSLRGIVDNQMVRKFAGAYRIMNDLYDMVREPEVDEHGVIKLDRHGFKIWARRDSGGFQEDFSRLTGREREDLLFKITTSLCADAWRATFDRSAGCVSE